MSELLVRFYSELSRLEDGLAGQRVLGDCSGLMDWPARGVYFFFEDGQYRSSGSARVVRIGTHAVSLNSKSTLWTRLRTHLGTQDGVGSHRSSIFRLHVGAALLCRAQGGKRCPSWGIVDPPTVAQRRLELRLEKEVTEYMRRIRLLWLAVNDPAGPDSDRAYLERNAIALLSRTKDIRLDSMQNWLGKYSQTKEIRESLLWNVNHVEAEFDGDFLRVFSAYIDRTINEKLAGGQESLAPRGWRRSVNQYSLL